MVERACESDYSLRIYEIEGSLTTDTTVYRFAQAPDGTGYSWKITYGAGTATYWGLTTEWINVYIDSTGSKTFTCNTLIDAAAGLTADNLYLEVEYYPTAGQQYTAVANDFDPTGPDQTSGTASEWTKPAAGTGWIAQKLEVTVTVGKTGWHRARVVLNKVSKTVYVDPKIQVL
jgi:hypothetical protein